MNLKKWLDPSRVSDVVIGMLIGSFTLWLIEKYIIGAPIVNKYLTEKGIL